ncbi:error-prone DNA polymerase [Amycolatopsis sp. PS_44_ISF1]|uniref:error-prone DNA polymerase n=1 Tax=Amycolatopsis sp. PS_44_ISF1 TaxID=2974917 RepID=UPI0028DE4D93|nr:error-prone DNA polymerase [Amycolatopsis sp. PS_44_ISF1]MDT8913466.1 error-prone DNA polymerase [Amycolatopsis sp. PS_44_ISF1]
MLSFTNKPGLPWRELERIAAGRDRTTVRGNGGDSPAWSRKRDGYRRPAGLVPRADLEVETPRVPYAELHAHSYFSFLDGVCSPEELVEQAVRSGLDAMVLSDHDGMYGAVRFAEAARELGLRTGFGAELSLGLRGRQSGVPDPAGAHLHVIARGLEGYRRICRVLSRAQLAGAKGCPVYDLDEVTEELRGHVLVLSGCRKGLVRRALVEAGPAAAARQLRGLAGRFGAEHVAVELYDLGLPLDDTHNDLLAAMAGEYGLPTVATNVVHYDRPTRGAHADMVAAIRAGRSIEQMEPWLPPDAMAFIRTGAEQAEIFARYPGAVARAAQLGVEVAFDLALIAPELPPFPVPGGFADENAYLRHLTYTGAAERYGTPAEAPQAYAQLEHELTVIAELGFPGYFLVVWDIVRFCREAGILAQGRGSAANSAVCFALRISNVDAVKWKLLFERFLAPERDGPPDIDVDIESDRREEAIQYVYHRHGRFHAAQVANVITYRPRSAVRDAAKALGYSPGQQDAFGKQVDRWGSVYDARTPGPDGRLGHDIPEQVLIYAGWLQDTPRHLGVHSGGMVIADTPVSEVVPVEWATAEDRSVLQWDKDDCAAIGLTKFDLLGLGMLSALHYMTDLVAEHHHVEVDLGALDLADPAVYDMLCAADAVGVFQVESRAQLATLPRLRPREFYDLVVEVALIRPGPIQGGSVHPYLRRRDGAPWEHAHPLLAPALDRTLGVPLFQEQVMQMARDVAGFTPAEADQLRRAMGAKRSSTKMRRLAGRFFAGTDAHDIPRDLAVRIFEQIHAFSGYGFPGLPRVQEFRRSFERNRMLRCRILSVRRVGFRSSEALAANGSRHGHERRASWRRGHAVGGACGRALPSVGHHNSHLTLMVGQVFGGRDKLRSGSHNEFGSGDVPVRPALRWMLLPDGGCQLLAAVELPARARVRDSGTFSWNTSLRLYELVCGVCWESGHEDHAWALVDPAYEQVELSEAAGTGFELVALALDGAVSSAAGRIELRLDGWVVGEATLFVCATDRCGVLEHVRVAPGYRRRGYGRPLALAVLSRYDWSTAQPRWVRGDLRGRALAAVRRGAGYAWTTASVPDTDEARAFEQMLPVATDGGHLYCRHHDGARRLGGGVEPAGPESAPRGSGD